ncbi:hypothetical protein CEUSTIGMA_g955.t1 [Chlamydomonas eustigma]|uniref:Transmembrane protein n=1 Tax=Chlamydomonas eustigma TaxID=1157962 RepID=A0A250WRR3_9CHLO|nr:hypothetical protein CEUSTIGMA_g955.t1 [Chlamydomonas eustigma]|eukprot:GAX73503.1 hypothetical protein CEUSTIGMA_g955.t1 [Chlamydomonas eustigma]
MWRLYLLSQVQIVFWIVLATAVAFYGNGEHDLLTLTLYTKQFNRYFINAAITSTTVNVALFFYIFIWLEKFQGIVDATEAAPWAAAVGGGTFSGSVICFMLGMWPVFSFLSIPIVIIEVYGLVLTMHFAPTLGIFRVHSKKKNQ